LANPLWWPLALLVPLALLLGLLTSSPRLRPLLDYQPYVLRGLALVVLAAYIISATAYLASDDLFDHAEASVTCIAWYFWSGKEVYHPAGSFEHYNAPYGPALYVLIGTAQGLLGPDVLSTKLPGFVAALAMLGFLLAALYRETTVWTAVLGTGILTALLLKHFHFSFLPRPDSFLIMCSAAGLIAAASQSRAAPLLLGVAMGMAVNLKIHAPVYFAPMLVIAWQHGWGVARLLVALAIAGVVFALPFIMFANISLANYLGILQVAAHHGFDPGGFAEVMTWVIVTAVPFGILVGLGWQRDPEKVRACLREQGLLLLVLLGSIVIMLIPASKYGAGSYHINPFLPAMVYAAALLARGMDLSGQPSRDAVLILAAGYSWLLCCTGNALTNSWDIVRTAIQSSAPSAAVVQDLRLLLDRYGKDHVILAGIGESLTNPEDYPVLYQRYALVFDGMPIGLDPPGVSEYKLAGGDPIDLDNFLAGLRQTDRRSVMWVIPKNARPFSMPTLYPPREAIFSEVFRTEFAQRFKHAETTEWFDVYTENGYRASGE
jgi:hypothetical protein